MRWCNSIESRLPTFYLHGIGLDGGDRRERTITTCDALRDTPPALADIVITNRQGGGGRGMRVRPRTAVAIRSNGASVGILGDAALTRRHGRVSIRIRVSHSQ